MPGGRPSGWLVDHAKCQQAVDTLKREKDGEIERYRQALLHRFAVAGVDENCPECQDIIALIDKA